MGGPGGLSSSSSCSLSGASSLAARSSASSSPSLPSTLCVSSCTLLQAAAARKACARAHLHESHVRSFLLARKRSAALRLRVIMPPYFAHHLLTYAYHYRERSSQPLSWWSCLAPINLPTQRTSFEGEAGHRQLEKHNALTYPQPDNSATTLAPRSAHSTLQVCSLRSALLAGGLRLLVGAP